MLAKDYLNCRMEKGLMAKDEWSNLGLNFDKTAAEASTIGTQSTNNEGKKADG